MTEDGSMAEEASGMDEFDWVMKVRNDLKKTRKETTEKTRQEQKRQDKTRKNTPFGVSSNQKPSIIPGCSGS